MAIQQDPAAIEEHGATTDASQQIDIVIDNEDALAAALELADAVEGFELEPRIPTNNASSMIST